MHFALSSRSASSVSFVANQMQDRQFQFCHCMPFKRFCSSDSGPDMMFQCSTQVRYQGSHVDCEERPKFVPTFGIIVRAPNLGPLLTSCAARMHTKSIEFVGQVFPLKAIDNIVMPDNLL